jgi:hypothetical protein
LSIRPTSNAYESAQVFEVTNEWLTVLVGEGAFRHFHLLPGGVELVENLPQRFKNRFTKVVRVVSVDKEEVILAERVRV